VAKADIPVHANQLPRVMSQNGVALREDVAYTNHKGEENSGVRNRTEKALGKLHEVLGKILEADETVYFVCAARAPQNAIEQLLANIYTQYMTASVLIFTSRRLIHLLVKPNGTWRRSVRSVSWGDVAEAKVKGSLFGRHLALKYRNGKKETYSGLRSGDGKKVKVLVDAILSSGSVESTSAQGVVSLCPDCRAELTPRTYRCAQCRLEFKDEATAARRTFLIPGGGYFYVGMPLPGILFALVETLFLLSVIILSLGILIGGPPSPGEEPITWATVIPVLVFLSIEKLFTYYHVRNLVRYFIPAN